MANLPPGIVYLAQRLPYFCFPLGVVYALLTVFEVALPRWARFICYALSFPLSLMIQVQCTDFINNRAAKKHGAVIPPRTGDPSLGGVLSLLATIKAFKSGYPGDGLSDIFSRVGNTINMRILFKDRIFTTEPEYIKAVLATQFDEFEKGATLCDNFHSLLGTGVFASDGDMWKFHRSMTRPFFSRDRISHFDIFDRHADDALKLMKARFRQGHPVDFQDLVGRFTLDSATEFLFGKDVRSLSASLPYPFFAPLSQSDSESASNEFARAFGEAQLETALRTRFAGYWPLFEFWTDRTKAKMITVRKFLDPILAKAAESAGKRPIGKGKTREVQEGETLLDHLVCYTDDQNVLRDEIMNLGVAGRDTTAATLTFVVYMLSQHPDVLRRLRNEILERVGMTNRPTYNDFRDMKYLRAVINETLRLYPPVPLNARACKNGAVWRSKTPGGQDYYIPPKARIVYSVFLMHRREDLWGPDAQLFDPDRFLDDRMQRYLTGNPFIFLPFNAGPRICLGQQFAYHEVSFFLVRLLQSFSEIRLNTEAQPAECRPPQSWKEESSIKAREKVMLKTHLTLYSYGGLWIDMKEASAVEEV
ncbi:cytochrome P450 monooxygenase pc-3 [Desarmillaria tabescens]|uniref:Cytochrome P450 monooxygenase pc-3 n=1 Tax=Armillaria tabescens TaxID=1929756 RepID=A0AA39K706_ARMTA|nr:cytochrome P450 monooxygenase pc-3 [Desarmillaria tabescens]KAK0455744.1 cytochrome P450 monooxygenase pc-3 [Desarmillaria tabescens]